MSLGLFFLIGHFATAHMTLKMFQSILLTKIQSRISEKTSKKIVLLSCRKNVKTQFLGVVEFLSIFLIRFFKVVGFPSDF